nr:hypothetical protein [Microbispora oryzae]
MPVECPRGGLGEVDRHGVAQSLLAAGQGEQGLDEPFLVPARDQQAFQYGPQRRRVGVRVRERDLGHGPLQRQRCAQLVRGVGDEPALRGERGLQPVQQFVEGVGQLLELVGGPGHRQPPVEPLRGDVPDGRRHVGERPQDPSGGEPAHQQCGERRHRERDQGVGEQPAQIRDLLGVDRGRLTRQGASAGRRGSGRGPGKGGVFEEDIDESHQQHRGTQEQAAVEQGQPQPSRRSHIR